MFHVLSCCCCRPLAALLCCLSNYSPKLCSQLMLPTYARGGSDRNHLYRRMGFYSIQEKCSIFDDNIGYFSSSKQDFLWIFQQNIGFSFILFASREFDITAFKAILNGVIFVVIFRTNPAKNRTKSWVKNKYLYFFFARFMPFLNFF